MSSRLSTKIVLTLGVALLIALAGNAYADVEHINAGSCVPEDEAITNGSYRHEGLGGYVQFETGVTGTFRIFCPIPYTPGVLDNLQLHYLGDDGANTYIKAVYVTRSKTDGSVTERCSVTSNLSGFDSNVTTCPDINPGGHYRWAYIELHRTSAASGPTAYGVTMFD